MKKDKNRTLSLKCCAIASPCFNKSSAVAEIGDRGHSTHGPESRGRGCYASFAGELSYRLTQCGLGRGPFLYQVASSSIQPFGHDKREPKIGSGGCAIFSEGSLVPIEHKVAWAEAYRHTKCQLSPSSRLAITDIGRKWGAVPL